MDVPKGNRQLRGGEQELLQVSEGLQRSHQQAVLQGVDQRRLEELQQVPNLAGPEAAAGGAPDLVSCQTAADDTPASESVAEHLTHGRFTPDSPASGGAVGLSGHMEELLHVDHASFTNELLVQACGNEAEEDVKPLDSGSSQVEVQSVYPLGAQRPLPASSSTAVAFKSEESHAAAGSGTTTQTRGTLKV